MDDTVASWWVYSGWERKWLSALVDICLVLRGFHHSSVRRTTPLYHVPVMSIFCIHSVYCFVRVEHNHDDGLNIILCQILNYLLKILPRIRWFFSPLNICFHKIKHQICQLQFTRNFTADGQTGLFCNFRFHFHGIINCRFNNWNSVYCVKVAICFMIVSDYTEVYSKNHYILYLFISTIKMLKHEQLRCSVRLVVWPQM